MRAPKAPVVSHGKVKVPKKVARKVPRKIETKTTQKKGGATTRDDSHRPKKVARKNLALTVSDGADDGIGNDDLRGEEVAKKDDGKEEPDDVLVLPAPLTNKNQIADFLYFGYRIVVRSLTELENLVSEGQVNPRDVWVGYYRLEHVSARNRNKLEVVHWRNLMRSEVHADILRGYFVHHDWSSTHLAGDPVAKRGFEELAKSLRESQGSQETKA